MARDDIDFVVCLGDYVYGEAYHSVAGGTGVRDDAIGEPNPSNPDIASEALTLADYRAKYALYRSDKALRDLHAQVPDGRDLGRPRGPGQLRGRGAGRRARPVQALVGRRAATPATRPTSRRCRSSRRGGDRIYRSERHGRNVDLIMLDQRQYRADQPCGDAVAPPCAELGPAAPVPRPQPDELAQAAACAARRRAGR